MVHFRLFREFRKHSDATQLRVSRTVAVGPSGHQSETPMTTDSNKRGICTCPRSNTSTTETRYLQIQIAQCLLSRYPRHTQLLRQTPSRLLRIICYPPSEAWHELRSPKSSLQNTLFVLHRTRSSPSLRPVVDSACTWHRQVNILFREHCKRFLERPSFRARFHICYELGNTENLLYQDDTLSTLAYFYGTLQEGIRRL